MTTLPPPDRRGARLAALLALAIFAGASFLATRSTLFDRDEPRFAAAAVEMVASGNWLYPTFDGELRPDKPILVYWLMAGAIRAFGVGEWAVRCASPLSLALAAYVVFLVGRRYFGARAGLLAMGMLVLSPLALVEGTIATTDALLLLAVTAATASVAFVVADGPSAGRFALLALALAAGLLAKGPVGLALPLATLASTAWLLRGSGTCGRRFWLGTGLASCAALALALAWALPADAATNGEFARRGLGHHVVERVTTPLESHGGNFFLALPFYVPVVMLGFLPWILFLPAAISLVLGGRAAGERGRAILVSWTVPGFLLMSVVSTKLAHYVLPIWPGLALAAGAAVVAAERGSLAERDRVWLRRGRWFLSIPAAILVAALILAPGLVGLADSRASTLLVAALLAATVALGLRAHRRGAPGHAATLMTAGMALTWLVGIPAVMPAIERTKVAPAVAATIRARTADDVPVARFKFLEPSLDFYLGRPPIREIADEGELRAWTAERGAAVLVIARDRLVAARLDLPAERFEELVARRGFNLSKGKPLELVAIGRDLAARGR